MGRTFRRGIAAICGGVALMLGASSVGAQERFNPRVGLATTGPYYRLTSALRLNPLGLFVDGRVGYRQRLFNNPGRSILLRNTYVALGASVVASPAFVRAGVALEVQPLQILNLQVVYEPVVQWFGTFNSLQTFDNVGANFSDAGLRRANDAAEPANMVPAWVKPAQTARGWQLALQGTLQMRIGQTLAIRNTFRAVRSSYDRSTLNAGSSATVYYDPFYDIVAPLDGWVFANDLDVIASLTDLGTNIGLRYTVVAPQVGDAAVAGVTTTTHRLGPIVTYTFRERRHGWFNATTVFVLAQWWIQNQFRTGGANPDAVTQWAPMFVLGFSFRGDA